MLHPLITVVDYGVIQGKGLVAQGFIRAGEVVYRTGEETEFVLITEVLSWPEDKKAAFLHHAYQHDENLLAYDHDDSRFMNHSCDPNIWSLCGEEETMVARRDIHPGEEVTYDYATTEILLPYQLECHCGSANCRGRITNLDYQNPAWQAQYGDNLPQHTRKAIQAYNESQRREVDF